MGALNAAAGYALALNVSVRTVASRCSDLLGRDDEFTHGIVDDWEINNGEYVNAGRTWTAARVTSIRRETEEEFGQEKGQAAGAAALTELAEIAVRTGAKMADTLLSGNRAEKLKICNGFHDEVRGGHYDITPQSEHHLPLTAIINVRNQQ
ncbi:hypothetical protein CWE14_14020 [Aliidiomarina soli]|uniref:Uncharacterized protein n=2 Tax=Aliidiomarina soli TaxID=1928574 RepID=A0A432WCQ2_9GAMM|nr:hypothetical protein CWE14_14020 [Aliidiomarina soli]